MSLNLQDTLNFTPTSGTHQRFETPDDIIARLLKDNLQLEQDKISLRAQLAHQVPSLPPSDANSSNLILAAAIQALSEATKTKTNSAAIKALKVEKDQDKSSLRTLEFHPVLDFISSFAEYYRIGGVQHPLEFVENTVRSTFDSYIDDKFNVSLEIRYKDDACSVESKFLTDFLDYIIIRNPHITGSSIFTKSPMSSTSKVSSTDIALYVTKIRKLIKGLPSISSKQSTSSLVSFIMQGVQPEFFRLLFTADHPDYKEFSLHRLQETLDADAQRYEFINAEAGRLGMFRVPAAKDNADKRKPKPAAADTKDQADAKYNLCSNCKSPDHKRRDCIKVCTTCPPGTCTLPANECLVFNARRAKWNDDKEKKSQAKIEVSIPKYVSVSKVCLSTKQSSDDRDDCLFDTGTNRTIIIDSKHYDNTENVTQNRTDHATFADHSSVPISSTGTFLGSTASLIKNFDKNLIPANLFDQLNCTVVIADGSAYVLELTDSIRERLYYLINTAETKLTMSSNNGLYTTSISKLRAAFPELASSPSTPAICSVSGVPINSTYFTTTLSGVQELIKFWHLSLGHISKINLKKIVRDKLIDNLPAALTEDAIEHNFPLCHSCPNGNLAARALPRTSARVYAVGEACAIDCKVWGGPTGSPYLTHNGEGISIHAMDRGSGKSWTFLCKTKDHIEEYIERMHKIYKLNNHTLQEFQIDDEFLTQGVIAYLERSQLANNQTDMINIIDLHIAAPFMHGQNGAAESNIKTLQQLVVKQLTEHNLSPAWFGDCLLDSVDVLGYGPSKLDSTKSINELWNGERLDVRNSPILPFGSRIKAHINLQDQTSLSGRTRDCIYIGRARGYKGSIKLRTLDTMAIIIRYSFKVMGIIDEWKPSSSQIMEVELHDSSIDLRVDESTGDVVEGVQHRRQLIDGSRYKAARSNDLRINQRDYLSKIGMRFTDLSEQRSYKIVSVDFQTHHQGNRSSTPKTPYFKHYDVGLHEFAPRSDADFEWIPCAELLRDPDTAWDIVINRLEIANLLSSSIYLDEAIANDWTGDVATFCGHLPLQLRAHCARLDLPTQVNRVDLKNIAPPKSYDQMQRHPEREGYLASFLKEIDSIARHGGSIPPEIDIKDIPPHLILQLMPIFHKKYEGLDFKKFKCRLVVLGDKWKNIFHEETYAGMTRMETLKMFLAIVAASDMELSGSDVITAYLTTQLSPTDAKYYVRAPPGVPKDIMPYIAQPSCYIYGHPMAGRKFQQDYNRLLVDNGFTPTNYDPCCYVLHEEFGTAIVCTIVDDAPIAASSKAMEAHVHAIIQSKYKITVQPVLTHIAGIELIRDRPLRKITLNQNGKCEDLFDTSFPTWRDMVSADLPLTPMKEGNRSLPLTTSELLRQAIPCSSLETTTYRSKEGQMNWLTFTWPDILFAQRDKACQQAAPTLHDMDEVNRIILYMIRMYQTNNPGLTIGGTQGVQLIMTVDSSYNTSRADGHGQTGVTMHMGTEYGAFHAATVHQPIVTDSSTASEGVGAHIGVRLALPKRYFFNELGYTQSEGSRIFMDNIPYMKTIIESKGPSERSKHILIRFQIVKEAFTDQEITLEHLHTSDMVADILTKSLGPTQFHKLRLVLLGVRPLQVPAAYTANIKPNISID